MNKCAICDIEVDKQYFCRTCYSTYRDDIDDKKDWTKYLVNLERRRRERYVPLLIYLGMKWDVGDNGRLVRNDGQET